MPHLYLPEAHTETDLVLAGQLAEAMESEELYVTWTHDGGPGAVPRVEAVVREPAHPVTRGLAVVFFCVAELWRALTRAGAAPVEPRRESVGQRATA